MEFGGLSLQMFCLNLSGRNYSALVFELDHKFSLKNVCFSLKARSLFYNFSPLFSDEMVFKMIQLAELLQRNS